MPSQSALSADEKSKVKSTLENSTQKIITATAARIYFAHPQPNKWSYGGLQGALAFTRDNSRDAFMLRLVDLTGTRGVIWEHELYEAFEYNQDRPFFHSFAGDKCMIGFVFADEKDAQTFYKKVTTRKAEKVKSSSSEKKKSAKGGRIDKSMISGPAAGSFVHVAHMGYDPEKGFNSTNIDPSWTAFLNELEGSGVSREVINQDMDFIKDFIRDAQNRPQPGKQKRPPPPLPAPRNRGHTQQNSVASSVNGDSAPTLHTPPPPSRPVSAAPSLPAVAAPIIASHLDCSTAPATTTTTTTSPSCTRATTSKIFRTTSTASSSCECCSPASASCTTTRSTMALPTSPQPGRADLLASIRGQGVSNLRKTGGPQSTPSPPPASGAEESGGGGAGGNLTAALAAALLERNKRLGDSDEEDEDDDDWD
ncbi:actin regulatory protein [Suillus subluteus]|nr:actin regulatory protein [Suillus subluteus]